MVRMGARRDRTMESPLECLQPIPTREDLTRACSERGRDQSPWNLSKLLESVRPDAELPLQIRAHLALHLADLLKGERALTDNAPGFV